MSKPEDGIVVFLNPAGEAVGMGILADRRHVVTCAHVVNAALGHKNTDVQELPPSPVKVIFPYFRSPHQTEPVSATIIAAGWHPVQLPGTPARSIHDVAILGLAEDATSDVATATLGTEEPKLRNDFMSYRFVTGDPKGLHADGTIGAKKPDGTYQLRAIDFVAPFIEPGFSGSACWDYELTQTVGMVATNRTDTSGIAHMVPATVLREAFRLAGLAPATPQVDSAFHTLRSKAIAALIGQVAAVQVLSEQLCDRLASISDPPDSPRRRAKIVDSLIYVGPAAAIKVMDNGYKAATKNDPGTSCRNAILTLSTHIVPLIYDRNHIRYAIEQITSGNMLLDLPVHYETTIEVIMAGVDAQSISLKRPQDFNKFTKGDSFLLPDPPNSGVDINAAKFEESFVTALGARFAPGYPLDSKHFDQVVKTNMRNEIDSRERRFYCISYTSSFTIYRATFDRLRRRFPDIVFCGRIDQAESPDEHTFVYHLNLLLCRFAGIS